MNRILILLIAASLVTPAQAQLKPASKKQKPAEWPTLRANNNRDGRLVGKGEFKNAANLKQSIDFSTSEAYAELFPAAKNSTVQYGKGEIGDPDALLAATTEWQTELTTSDQGENGAYLDLKGDGHFTQVPVIQSVKYAKLFEGDNKYYRIEALDGFGTTVNDNDDTFIGIRVYEGNTNKLIFEKRFPKGEFMQRPHVTVADMDNNNQKDIVITSWEGIYVFNNRGDSIAGLSQNVKGWHHLRKRGFASLQDIDGNGYKDVVIISSLPWHMDVIKNDHGVLKFGWTHIFDGFVETAHKISKPILNSVNDFDGDGTFEILVNIYNYNDDKNWSAVLFDATNGEVKAQIKGVYVVSAEDLNNDGKFVMFCTETQGQSVPLAAALKAVTFQNGAVKEHFRLARGEWINPRVPNTLPTITTHGDGISSLAEDVVLCADYEGVGQRAFFAKTRNADGSSVINAYYITKEGSRKTALGVNIPADTYGEILRARKNTDGKYSLLLQLRAFATPATTVKVDGATIKNLGRYITTSSKTFIPIVADLDGDGALEILLPNDVGEVLCFNRTATGATLKWRVPGHGMKWQYAPPLEYGVAADDLNHDGKKEVIVSGADEAGAIIALYDHKGKLLWKTGFPEIHAGEITSWDGNVAFYGTAQSSKRKGRDVIVTVQRGIAHGGKTYCLDGTNGAILWGLDRLEADRGDRGGKPIDSGAGGYVFSTYDIDKDGSDEIMCGYGNIVFFADANDGAIKFKAFMRKVFTDKFDYPAHGYTTFWMQQITPVAFDNQGKLELSCFNTMIGAGTMDTQGALTWCPKTLDYTDRYWQCMANLDGDGKLWVVELSQRNTDHKPVLFAYDPATGDEHKTFSMEMPGFTLGLRSAVMPVACDMNGDGKDEIVVSNNDGVYCLGSTGGKAAVLWKYPTPNCGPPVIADVDADGFVEVVLATQNGKILILDK